MHVVTEYKRSYITCTHSMQQIPSWEANRSSVKKHRAFYGNRRFINTFKITRHLSLSLATSIQSITQSHFFKVRCNTTLQSKARSYKWARSHKFHQQNACLHSALRYTCYASRQSNSSWFDHPKNSRWEVQTAKRYIAFTLTADSLGIF